MYSDVVISAKNLTKTYRIFGHPGDRIKQAFTLGRVKFHREFTALKDVSVEIKRGETIGIIGRNGSGKSTLLQLICGILKPTSGSVTVNGRVSALLELGAGFNPEFTGRENVYFQGALMGFTKAQIDERFDTIAAFADIGEFTDQPVRTYSSGMFVRLAFAVAVHVDPDIIVIDEALAVGDARFQSLCFRRIMDIRDAGGTILFVSHAPDQVIRICSRAVLMDRGEVLASGIPKQIVGQFQKLLYAPIGAQEEIRKQIRVSHTTRPQELVGEQSSNEYPATNESDQFVNDSLSESYDPALKPLSMVAYESHGAFIDRPEVTTLSGRRVNNILSGKTYRYTYTVRFERDARNVRFGMLIKTNTGIELGGASSAPTFANGIPVISRGASVRVEFQFNCMLNPGVYFLNAGVTGEIDGAEAILHRLLDGEIFRVMTHSASMATAIVDFGCKSEIHITDNHDSINS